RKKVFCRATSSCFGKVRAAGSWAGSIEKSVLASHAKRDLHSMTGKPAIRTGSLMTKSSSPCMSRNSSFPGAATIETGTLELVIEFLVERWFRYVEYVLLRQPSFLDVNAPVEAGRERLQLHQVNFVVEFVRIAPFHPR